MISHATTRPDEGERLRELLDATRSVGEGLQLTAVLHRIVDAAAALLGARFGALGVRGSGGGLAEFVYTGVDDAAARRIGHPPRGSGVLSAVLDAPGAVTIDRLPDDERFVGMPDGHPQMTSFIGVPIVVRDRVFGSLYVASERPGAFGAEDEQLLTSLAASAGIAIDNARLFEQAEARRRLAEASAELAQALLADADAPLTLVADAVIRLTGASAVALLTASPAGGVRVDGAWGPHADVIDGLVFPRGTTAAERVIRDGEPQFSSVPRSVVRNRALGPTVVVPILRPEGDRAAFTVVRPLGAQPFSDDDLELAREFAVHAGVALQRLEAGSVRDRLTLLEDRARIARDLHDNVIQRIFGAGLTLGALDDAALPDGGAERVATATRLLDEAIAEIRSSVHQLRSDPPDARDIRRRVRDVAGDFADAFASPPRVVFDGDPGGRVSADLLPDIEAVVREGLANAARHAGATEVIVAVAVDRRRFVVAVSDDGRGPGGAVPTSGLVNLTARAAARGGTSGLRPGAAGGAVLEWSVPLGDGAEPAA